MRDLFEPDEPAPPPMRIETDTGPILIGTSGYSFDDWEGPFYPRGTPKGKRLDYYVTQFPCVEINSTYYRIPHPAVMARLEEKTPPGFEFTVKANEAMTHRRSTDPGVYRAFLECLEPLRRADKLRGVVFQFPWAFRNEELPRRHLAFVRTAIPDLPLWVEFRHDSWDRPEVYRYLEDQRLGFIAVDEPALPGLFPPTARVTSDVAYVRFHGRNAKSWWGRDGQDRYDWDYDRRELGEWVERIRRMAARARKTYVFFNNCYMGRAVRSARLMSGLLRGESTAAD
jgi:uncharacterized protein YecE (DUF72 family)